MSERPDIEKMIYGLGVAALGLEMMGMKVDDPISSDLRLVCDYALSLETQLAEAHRQLDNVTVEREALAFYADTNSWHPYDCAAIDDAGAQARSALAASTPALPAASAPAAATSVDACITAIQTLVQRVKATEGDTWTALQRESAEMIEEYRQRGLWHAPAPNAKEKSD